VTVAAWAETTENRGSNSSEAIAPINLVLIPLG